MYYSAFFNSRDGDRVYKAEAFAEFFASFIGNGVFPNPSTGLQVQEGEGMRVIVRAGRAWINGYFFHNEGDYILTLDGADGVLRRIDRVVVRWDLPDREITLAVKKGSLSSAPAAPTLQRDAEVYELALADVAVNAGAVTVTQADITDQRLNTAVCGIVKGTIEEIDTTTLALQLQEWFETFREDTTGEFMVWFESIRDILDENVAAHLLSLIETKQDSITAGGILKGDGEGNISPAVAETDYATPESVNAKQNTITASGILKGSGAGSISAAVGGTDYATPTSSARILRASVNYYLNADTGVDTNNGTSVSTAWRTITRLVEELNKYEIFLGDVIVNLSAGTYTNALTLANKYFQSLQIQRYTGTVGTVYISTATLTAITGNVRFYNIQTKRIELRTVQYVTIEACGIDGGVLAASGSSVTINNSAITSTSIAVRCEHSTVTSYRNSGSGTTGLSAYSGIIFKGGTQPTGTTSNESALYGGRIFGD